MKPIFFLAIAHNEEIPAIGGYRHVANHLKKRNYKHETDFNSRTDFNITDWIFTDKGNESNFDKTIGFECCRRKRIQ